MIAEYIAEIQKNPDWIGYGMLAVALLLALVLILLVWRRSDQVLSANGQAALLEERNDKLAAGIIDLELETSGLQREILELKTSEARLQEALIQQRAANIEKIELLNATGDKLKGEFKNLAADVMRTHGEDFEKANQVRLRQVLEPLKQNIENFKTEMQGVQRETIAERATLKNEIKTLTERSMQVSVEAENLTRALKADAQKQGAWGEMVLASILDRSGLRAGEEYETQVSQRNDDGAMLRPDVVVNLPGGRKLVIDSKVSLVAYERAMNADDAAAKDTAMKGHVLSVKTHIDTLSAKKYHELDDNSVDYVIMFMPIESAFSEAVRANSDLALYAVERDVVIASPTNLMVALKTVENLWSVERRNKNALEIAKRAGRLYDKFHDFVGDMEKIGAQLETAQKTHGTAMDRLTRGRGNLLTQADTLKKLGARAAKQITLEAEDEDSDLGLSE